MSINRVILTGNIGKEIDLKYTQSGKAVANFSLAVTDSFDREKTNWINIVVWNKTAESCASYLSKGSKIGIDGRIQVRDYENQEGKKVYVTEVVADRVEFLDSKKSGESKPQEKPQGGQDKAWAELGNIEIEDGSGEDIPF